MTLVNWRSLMSNDISKNIKKAAKEKNLSQKDIANITGLTESAVSRYFNGSRTPNADALNKIAMALGTSSAALLGSVVAGGLGLLGTAIHAVNPLIGITALGTMSVISKSKIPNRSESKQADLELEKLQKTIENSKKQISGTIVTSFINKGYSFKIDNNEITEDSPDLCLYFDNEKIKSWWFVFWDNEFNRILNITKNDLSKYLVSKFMLTKPDRTKKSSLVVKDKELFDFISKLNGKISYKGNLSVLLIDTNSMSIVNEKNISYYDDNEIVELNIVPNE